MASIEATTALLCLRPDLRSTALSFRHQESLCKSTDQSLSQTDVATMLTTAVVIIPDSTTVVVAIMVRMGDGTAEEAMVEIEGMLRTPMHGMRPTMVAGCGQITVLHSTATDITCQMKVS